MIDIHRRRGARLLGRLEPGARDVGHAALLRPPVVRGELGDAQRGAAGVGVARLQMLHDLHQRLLALERVHDRLDRVADASRPVQLRQGRVEELLGVEVFK